MYDDPHHENYKLCHDNLASLSLAEIDAIPRQMFTRVSNLEFDLFMLKKKGKARANEEMKNLEPKNVLSKGMHTEMNSQDNKLDFKVEGVKEAIERKKKKKKRDEELNKPKRLDTEQ